MPEIAEIQKGIPEFEAAPCCADCGRCCKAYAGAAMPSDFGQTEIEVEERLKAAFATGLWAIDWWDGPLGDLDSPRFVRPRHKGEPIVCGSWGAECVFLADDGCQLAFHERPTGCRALEPLPTDECVGHLSIGGENQKATAARAWAPYARCIRWLEKEAGDGRS